MPTTYAYPRKLRGYTVALTNANTKYSLITLIAAIDPKVLPLCRELNIQSDPTNTVGSYIWMGDYNISTSQRGSVISPAQTKTYVIRSESDDIADIYVMTDTNAQKLNVEMVDF